MSRSILWILSIILAVCLVSVSPSNSNADDELVGYRVVIVGDKFNPFASDPRVDRELGTYKTYEQASKAALDWSEANPMNYGLWRIDTIKSGRGQKMETVVEAVRTIDDAKRAVDKARVISKQGWLKAYSPKKDRKFLSNLKEYKSAIQDASKRVLEFKITMVSGAQGITQKDFKDINNLISEFNDEAQKHNVAADTYDKTVLVEKIDPVWTTIKFQNPSVVDVAPVKTTPAPSLEGNTYSGSVGGARVEMAFYN